MSQTQGRVSINPFPTVYNSGIELRGGGGGAVEQQQPNLNLR